MSASESGLGWPFLGPWRWGRACLSGSGPRLGCSFAYICICKFHLLTLAGLGKTPVQKAQQDPTLQGWLPEGAATQDLGPCFTDRSNAFKPLNCTLALSLRSPGCPGQKLQSFSYPSLSHSPSPLGGCLRATFLSVASAITPLGSPSSLHN